MTTTITRITKPPAPYHQWAASELTNNDIIGVWESLGRRVAHSITIESIGGASTIRFNVIKQVYREFSASEQVPGMGQGAFRTAPTLVGEVEIANDNIIIESGNTQTWYASEIGVKDIKIISKSSGLKITIT